MRVGDGYAPTGHEPRGEHPLGLAVDLYPGPGGSWREVARLARWAEPRQNRPRPPCRWVGWTRRRQPRQPAHLPPPAAAARRTCTSPGPTAPGRPRRPVRTVWVFEVGVGTLARGALMSARAAFPKQTPLPDL